MSLFRLHLPGKVTIDQRGGGDIGKRIPGRLEDRDLGVIRPAFPFAPAQFSKRTGDILLRNNAAAEWDRSVHRDSLRASNVSR